MPFDLFPDRQMSGDSGFSGIPAAAQDHYQKASELLHQGKTEDALRQFRQAVEIAPHFTHALHEMGNCLNVLGRQEEACRYYNRALHEIGNRLYEIGRQEESAGNYWVAIGQYEEAGKYLYRNIPDHPVLHNGQPDKSTDPKKAGSADRFR